MKWSVWDFYRWPVHRICCNRSFLSSRMRYTGRVWSPTAGPWSCFYLVNENQIKYDHHFSFHLSFCFYLSRSVVVWHPIAASQDSLDVDSRYYYCDYYCFFSSFTIILVGIFCFEVVFFSFFPRNYFQPIFLFSSFILSLPAVFFLYIYYIWLGYPNLLLAGWRLLYRSLCYHYAAVPTAAAARIKTSPCEENSRIAPLFFLSSLQTHLNSRFLF